MAGSIILQRPIAEPGQLERVYSPETIVWLDHFGLLDVFHSWWFLLQLFLLTINITVASIEMWPKFKSRIESFQPILRNDDIPEMHAVMTYSGDKKNVAEKISVWLSKKFRKPVLIEKEGRYYLGAQSARFAHLGVYIIHAGLITVLIGGLIGNRKGFEGQILLSKGEQTNFYNDRNTPGKRVFLDFTIRCTGTRMEKYPDGSPKAYFSDLEVVDEGRVVLQKTIKVNDPLIYKDIYFYQATFGQKPADEKTIITLEVFNPKNGKIKTVVTDFEKEEKLPQGGFFRVIDYSENIPLAIEGHARNLGEAVQLELSEQGGEPKPVWLFKEFPNFDKEVRKGKYQFVFKNFKEDYRIVEVTGLQVARNPGIKITWTGSALLLLGLLATFFIPHRKLWAVVEEGKIFIAASSHRHPETFAKKVRRMVKELPEILKEELGKTQVTLSPQLLGEWDNDSVGS